MSERTHEMTTWSDLEVPAVVDQMTADYHHCGSHQLALTLFMDRGEAEQLRDKLNGGAVFVHMPWFGREEMPATDAMIRVAERMDEYAEIMVSEG